MKRRFLFLVLTGLLATSFPGTEPLSGQVGPQEVTSLRFVGNREFSGRELSRAIITRETECRSILFQILPFCLAGSEFSLDRYYLNDRILREDFARIHIFYLQRGFREVVVDTTLYRPNPSEVEITFHIQEGEPITVTDVEFLGAELLPDSSVLEDLPVNVGEPLSLVALDATRDTLERRLRNSGFAHADVLRNYFIPTETPHEAQVTVDVFPGPLTRFGPLSVVVVGRGGREPTVEEDVVLRMLPYREGHLYSEDLRFQGRRTLYNQDIFRIVNDTLVATKEDSILPLAIRVEEGNLHRVRTGAGYSTAECFDVEASWGSRNFMGGFRRLQVTGRVGNVLSEPLKNTVCRGQEGGKEYRKPIGSISVDFTQPWFYSPRNSISARVYGERQSFPDVFIREALGMSLGLTHALAPSTFVGVSYRPQISRLDLTEVLFCSAYLICDRSEIDILEKRNLLSPVGITFSRDSRDQLLNPTRGHSLAVDFEHADQWTGSEFGYSQLLSEASWHTRPSDQLVLGTHLRAGWVDTRGFESFDAEGSSEDFLHPEKRLFSGGANSVRGFAQNRLGPQVLYLERSEELILPRGTVQNPQAPLCTEFELKDGTCDANGLPDKRFLPRPKGGTRLLEGSVEVRFPLGGVFWEGATFLDFGQVWDEDATPGLADLEFTPGFGVRYFSPIGPIRVDLGYRFQGGDYLRVVANDIELNPETGKWDPTGDLILLDKPVLWGEDLGRWNLKRFQLHLSIGQAF